MLETLIDIIVNNFDFSYMIIINVLTYLIIKLIDFINKEKNVSTLVKRICLVCSIIIVTLVYSIIGYENKIIMFNSAILSPVFYSWVLRPILKKFKIGYKEYDKTLK